MTLPTSSEPRLRVLFLALGGERVASSRTRVNQYLPYLRELGVEAEIIRYERGLEHALAVRFSPRSRFGRMAYRGLSILVRGAECLHAMRATIAFVWRAHRFHVAFVQKVVLPAWAQRILERRGVAIVFDFDDAIYAHERCALPLLERLVRTARLAVVENEENAEYVRRLGTRSLRVTGPIECRRYRPTERPPGRPLVIGWIGSSSTTPYLEILREPLRILAERSTRFILRLIGAGWLEMDRVAIERYPWSLETEVEILCGFDVGVMPLPDDEWTRGKGGYKILQYMAAGIPAVCSPVGVNREIVLHGVTGYLAQAPSDWVASISTLAEDPGQRSEMGRAARERAETLYSFECYTPLLVEELRRIVKPASEGRR